MSHLVRDFNIIIRNNPFRKSNEQNKTIFTFLFYGKKSKTKLHIYAYIIPTMGQGGG